jgi:hypothetical protein
MLAAITLTLFGHFGLPVAAPVLGTPTLTVTNLRRAWVAIWEVTGAPPNKNVAFFVSLTGPGPTTTTVGNCSNVTLSLSPNLILLATVQASSTGRALATYPIPARASGRSTWSQAVALSTCETTNMVFAVVQ